MIVPDALSRRADHLPEQDTNLEERTLLEEGMFINLIEEIPNVTLFGNNNVSVIILRFQHSLCATSLR